MGKNEPGVRPRARTLEPRTASQRWLVNPEEGMLPVPSTYHHVITRFATGMSRWVQELQQASETLLGVEDFPAERLMRLSQWEAQQPALDTMQLRYYVALAYGCLTTAFIMTQRHAALRRLESSSNPLALERWLPAIRSGERFATVGISHLTTSRQHLRVPPVLMRRSGSAWELHGVVPWVTGAPHADYLVVGAVEDTRHESSEASPAFDRQYLLLVPCPNPKVLPGRGMELLALTSSCTDVVHFDGCAISPENILHGPSENVMAASSTGGAGGLQTSALALGLAASAIEYLEAEGVARQGLVEPSNSFRMGWQAIYDRLTGDPSCDAHAIRKQSNDLALQATQAALAAAKGAGYIAGSRVERWCREALFFLVWSCPQPVAEAHLCSFASTALNMQ